ncbi:MAG: DNA-3-methyladenine glycosylase 2 family protein [Gemmatimonadota bacterium]|jgi:DNA-3-methyladenine glycosylase II|nr:DNA-3-methyladenine glycosylase 2 family protein [Gemmatimonadota bacterium]
MTEQELTAVWTGGRRKLGKDPVFGPWAKHIGTIRLPVSEVTPFFYLVRAICYQQLAGKAARTIHGRVIDALKGDVSPQKVLRVRETTLRKAGLSRAKYAAVRDLAMKVRSGQVELHDLEQRSDDEIIERLVSVRGIGVWTAQMYAMFRLRRPDVWPVGDLAVRAGYGKVHGLEHPPTAKELEPLGDAYRPWRSAAAWYCYRVLDTELP